MKNTFFNPSNWEENNENPKKSSENTKKEYIIAQIVAECVGWRYLNYYGNKWFMRSLGTNQYILFDNNIFRHFIYTLGTMRGVSYTSHECRAITDEISVRTGAGDSLPNSEAYMMCRNGFLVHSDGSFLNSIPSAFSTICVEGNYLGQGTFYHPVMDAFLATLFANAPMLIQRAWEIIGYCISADSR